MPRKRVTEAPDAPAVLVFEGEAKRAVQELIVGEISEGKTLSELCRREGMPKRRTVYDWIDADPEFAKRLDIARDLGADAIAEEALQIADTPEEGVELEISAEGETKEKRGDMLGHRKLRVETRLKLLAKWHPKKYGDKVTAELTGKDGGPIKVVKLNNAPVPELPE